MAKRLTDTDRSFRELTESQWQAKVESVARKNGWVPYHAPANRPDKYGNIQNVEAGFPDLCIIRSGKMIFAELKKETGKLSAAQVRTIELIKSCGLECYVWRPSDVREVLSVLEAPNKTA
jgi:hypothetical protein